MTGGLGDLGPAAAARAQRQILSLPQVEDGSIVQFVTDRFELPNGTHAVFPEALVLGDASGRDLVAVNRAKVLRGRLFDPDAPDEAVLDVAAAEHFGVSVGDVVSPMLIDRETFEPSIRRPVTIVGIVVAPGSLPAVGQSQLTGLNVSPGFMRANEDHLLPDADGPSVTLARGSEQIREYVAAVRAIAPQADIPIILPRHVAGVQKTLRFDVAALWIMAGLVALSSVVILGQALVRQMHQEGGSHPVLHGLGISRAQMVGIDLVRAVIVGVGGSVVSVAVAVALSPLAPRGLARLVEPAPGFDVDAAIIAGGALGTLVVPLLVTLGPSLRAARRRSDRIARVSSMASILSAAGAGPATIAGARLALESGRGTRAVPVRATIAGVAVALAAFIAAGSFTQSFTRLVSSPELYGFGWDVFGGDESGATRTYIERDPDIETSSPGGYGNVVIAGIQLIPLIYEPGTIEPTILEGVAPTTSEEIALGRSLMKSLGIGLGETIMVARKDADPALAQRFTVVGRVVVPPVFFQQVEPGESSAITVDGWARLDPGFDPRDGGVPYLIKFRAGADVEAEIAAIRAAIPGFFAGQVRAPGAELASLTHSSGLPIALTFVLLALAVATLAHTLVSSIRKRRPDLAILKTLGFERRQVRAAVVVQSSVLVGMALLIGVPVGLIMGRTSWRWFADTLGVVPAPVTPLLLALILVPAATLALANAIGSFPARAAGRTQPALILRSE